MIELIVYDRERPKFLVKSALCCGILFFLILAGMRFYAGHLEQEVALTARAIERLSREEESLRQQLLALKSPHGIYNNCADRLKMERAADVGILIRTEGE